MKTAKEFLSEFRIYEFDEVYNCVGETFPLLNLMEDYAKLYTNQKLDEAEAIKQQQNKVLYDAVRNALKAAKYYDCGKMKAYINDAERALQTQFKSIISLKDEI